MSIENRPDYQLFPEIFEQIEPPQREPSIKLFTNYHHEMRSARGSSYNHQAWPEGYLDHVAETMNIARELYDLLKNLRPLPFTLSEALVVLYMHDLEKPWKHVLNADQSVSLHPELADKSTHLAFKLIKAEEVGLVLNDAQLNALKYVEGEGNDYSREKPVMQPLAAFCHMNDVASARLWPEYPNDNDPWGKRHGSNLS